jgi:hypothetical protein
MTLRSLTITPPTLERTRAAERHTRIAVAHYQDWDREMIRLHGPLYYREMGWTLH